ncbi:MAG TPA: SDR family NAD(P)-dependent oxidoreductase [Trebonia sp.]|jgi:NAD(P)-dependent dehydrogenase (short-subunit alcohol dehydrogenase family)|nr:SDR family NAD(P)-dependent oxidoreductase [Trebonia sp.]
MPVIVITGCSSGIGRAIARQALERGFTTVATARDPGALADLAAAGAVVRRLDVTDDGERRQAVKEVLAAHGAIDVLVNNAGYGELGPCEEVPLDRWAVQFETNLFGPVGLIQLVLPGMRARGQGRIVNVSSMAGELVLPAGAAYHASKFALEGATEVLRLEAGLFGIGVSLVQPGAVNSRWGQNISPLRQYRAGPYGDMVADLDRQIARRLPRGTHPDQVAAAVLRAATARHPRARYRVGAEAHVLLAARRLMPAAAWAQCVRTQFPSLRARGAAR